MTTDTIVLRNMRGEVAVNGAVTYDDTSNLIVFTPTLPLTWAATYELSLTSVTSPDDLPLHADGLTTRILRYTEPGADDAWMTTDDPTTVLDPIRRGSPPTTGCRITTATS